MKQKKHRAPIDLIDRPPPFDSQAEADLLGSIILAPQVLDEVAPIVRPEDFYDDAHRRLFARMCDLHAANEVIDITLLIDRLKAAGDFEAVGGTAYLYKIVNAVAVPAHAVYYAEIVRRKADCRRLIAGSLEVVHDAYSEAADPIELASRLEVLAGHAVESTAAQVVEASSSLAAAVRFVREAIERQSGFGVATGLSAFDRDTGGFWRGELIVLAARPGIGKTTLAMQFANRPADRGDQVLYVTLEMGHVELAQRMLAAATGIRLSHLRSGAVTASEVKAIETNAIAMGKSRLRFLDMPRVNVPQIRWHARRLHRTNGLALLVVDYLGLVTPQHQDLPRYEQVGQITRDLKELARTLNVPVLVIAQLNRESEKTGGRPRLAHLRESGNIEQDADMVMFLHREDRVRPDDPDAIGRALLIVEKNRNGDLGEFPLVWDPVSRRYSDPSIEPRW